MSEFGNHTIRQNLLDAIRPVLDERETTSVTEKIVALLDVVKYVVECLLSYS